MFLSKPHYKKFFQLHYQDPTGKWRKVSTESENRKGANKFKEDFKLKQFQAQQEQAKLHLVQLNTPLTFSKLSNDVLENNETNLSISTSNIYKRSIREFIRIVGDKNINDLKLSHFEQFKTQRKTEVEDCTVNVEIRTLKRIFNLGIMYEIIDRSPAKFCKQIDIGDSEIVIFNEDEFQTLLNGINLDYFKKIVQFGYLTGCRLNEILTLQWSNIDFKSKVIYIGTKAGFKTKTRKNRKIPMTPEVLEILRTMLVDCFELYDSERYIFPNPNGVPFNKSYISRKFRYYIKRTGLPEKLHFHCLRHTYITNLLRQNVPIYKVMQLVGHRNIKTTMLYLHLIVEDLRAGAEMITLPSATMQLG